MLRTCAMGWSPAHLIAAYVLSLDFYWRQFNLEESVHPRNGNHAYLICCHQGVACIMSDKHGFRFYQPISPGAAFHHAQTPCLEKPIPHQGLEVIPGIIIMSCTCFKLGFCPSTVQVVASYLISMVFEIRHPKLKCRWFFGRVFSFPLVEEFV